MIRLFFFLIVAVVPLSGCGGGSSEPKRGEVVSFEPTQAFVTRCGATPGSIHQARIVGLPGDVVVVDPAGKATVNGKTLSEPYATHTAATGGGSWRVPKASYFLLSDNRNGGCDSRVYGAVPAANLVSGG